jgi:hypothetical protein
MRLSVGRSIRLSVGRSIRCTWTLMIYSILLGDVDISYHVILKSIIYLINCINFICICGSCYI